MVNFLQTFLSLLTFAVVVACALGLYFETRCVTGSNDTYCPGGPDQNTWQQALRKWSPLVVDWGVVIFMIIVMVGQRDILNKIKSLDTLNF